ncbi:DUF1684 domain-containing protein [Arthrobacter jiangjiafuii]|uniref:DUF1684 domain-containing protein n=1 Tax=Arthrobacter jiangjiafuii TaxID=2817475 RepID=A0A975R049_9MICC|nr:DUF1684 domain-containing protein [Arthrobacter jiangjiafuii]MBP3045120.1 DUF1684 domain-containing protein [Arthrobacter jiangjiafuii]QWC10565.1 DUF1684 domain-containing protein [Arthrobacter jiangjiafuii]
MSTPTDDVADQWLRFRAARNKDLAQAHGWLTLTSLQWLLDDPAALDGVPGLWSGTDTGAVLSASTADGLVLVETGQPVTGTVTATLADEESLLWVRYGGHDGGQVVVELARRGGRYAVRTRDAASPVFLAFDGVPVFDFRPELVLDARFEAYEQPVDVPVRTANPAVDGAHRTVGELAFRLPESNKDLRLQVSAEGPQTLAMAFHDATNNQSTAAWRKVTFSAPAPGTSTVTVDFNRAVNYPSAFTPYGTCPMPVGSNIIGEPVEAGEKLPQQR